MSGSPAPWTPFTEVGELRERYETGNGRDAGIEVTIALPTGRGKRPVAIDASGV